MEKTYEMKPTSLPFCQGIWNEEKKRYESDNSLDAMKCCIHNCADDIKFCFDKCHANFGKNGKQPNYDNWIACQEKCREIKNLCQSICYNTDSQGIKVISECSNKAGCNSYPTLDTPCMKKNGDAIVSCCLQHCLSSTETNCDSQCRQFYEYLSLGLEKPLEKIIQENEGDEFFTVKKSNKDVLIVFYVVYCILIIFAGYILFGRS
jgi:hypothetical protein